MVTSHGDENIDGPALREFVNGYVYERFQDYVCEAVRLAATPAGGTNGPRVSP